MSRLHANETGRVIPTLSEEVNARRHARSHLDLPASSATLYLLAKAHHRDGPPLRVYVNDQYVGAISAADGPVLAWHELPVPEHVGTPGAEVTLSSEGAAMSGWMVGVDHSSGGDVLSVDGGRTWTSDRIGYLHVAPGRYVIRARVPEGEDPKPPVHTWEDPDDQSVRDFRDMLPTGVGADVGMWQTVRELSTWVARSWTYRNTDDAQQYAPWDAPTILDWGATSRGHAGQLPVVMCVHYAIVLASACESLGIRARCAALTGSIGGFNGHFVTEVWLDDLSRWAMIDPTYDVAVEGRDGPLGLRAIRELGSDLRGHLSPGPGMEDRLATLPGRRWFHDNFLRGVCFRNRSLWPRSDFLSRPDLSPPSHGSSAYSELELVWETRCRDNGFGMFRYFADDAWFDAPPVLPAAVGSSDPVTSSHPAAH